jgi:hypothetical protein
MASCEVEMSLSDGKTVFTYKSLCLSLAGAFVMVTAAPKIVANASRGGKF